MYIGLVHLFLGIKGCVSVNLLIRNIFVGEGNIFFWLWWSLCQVVNWSSYQLLPEYYPADEEKANTKLFASNVRDVIADALNAEKTGG